jgi:hypothetical protein
MLVTDSRGRMGDFISTIKEKYCFFIYFLPLKIVRQQCKIQSLTIFTICSLNSCRHHLNAAFHATQFCFLTFDAELLLGDSVHRRDKQSAGMCFTN